MPDLPVPGEAQARNAQGQFVESPAPAQVANTQGGGDGPWADRLAATFADAATRSQVDAFLRSEVQPYTTRLEQQLAQARPASDLYTNLSEAPAETYLQITEELFGPEAVESVIGLLLGQEEAETPAPEVETPPSAQPVVDPEVEAMKAEWKAQKDEQLYEEALAKLKAKHEGDTPITDKLFHPFVFNANGDMEAAYRAYKEFYTGFQQETGTAPEP